MIHLLRGVLGIAFLLGIAFALSYNRRAIRPRIVIWGIGLQLAIGLFIFKTEAGEELFRTITTGVAEFLKFSYQGTTFVFGELGKEPRTKLDFSLAFQALPIVIYFSAVMAVLYHFGIMQWIIYALARLLSRILGVSGAESMAVVANVFVGMTEAPLVVRPYIEPMTRSELMTLATGGFATIAGSVLGVYLVFVGEEYGAYLIAASVMSAPAAFVMAKIILPEEDEPLTGEHLRLVIEKEGVNVLDALARGVRNGLKLALNIAAMLIAFYAILALINWPLEAWFGVKLEKIFGYLLAPVAWFLGIDWGDATEVGGLLGIKIALNEFVAYDHLRTSIEPESLAEAGLSRRSIVISTFALCGFANFGSIGVVLGGVGPLAPSRRGDLARLVFRAMIGGALASFLTATVAGMFASPSGDVYFYREEPRRVPALGWLTELRARDGDGYRECLAKIRRLARLGDDLGAPEAKHLGDGIHELRAGEGERTHRLLYFFWREGVAVLLHASSAAGAVSDAEVELARRRMESFVSDPEAHAHAEEEELSTGESKKRRDALAILERLGAEGEDEPSTPSRSVER